METEIEKRAEELFASMQKACRDRLPTGSTERLMAEWLCGELARLEAMFLDMAEARGAK